MSIADSKHKKMEAWASEYFEIAKSWAYDIYTSTLVSRNRWRLFALGVLTPITMLLIVCISMLIPNQHLLPIVVHHYQNGLVRVAAPNRNEININIAHIKSNLVRYLIEREAYSPYTYKYQYDLINLLSSHEVSTEYVEEQSVSNKLSPINRLGESGYIEVKIHSVLILDRQKPKKIDGRRNLAQVDFTRIEHDKSRRHTKIKHCTALISWEFSSIPLNPEAAWKNWDGFKVTHYHVQERNSYKELS